MFTLEYITGPQFLSGTTDKNHEMCGLRIEDHNVTQELLLHVDVSSGLVLEQESSLKI
jgi:hypothetical protein